MSTGHPDRETVRAAIALAVRAPSVHNTQPWRWLVGQRGVHLMADWTRRLRVSDPDGRNLVVSCGAALHHLRTAFAGMGYATHARLLPNPDDRVHLAAVEPHSAASSDDEIGLTDAMGRRQTDRRRYSSWPVPAEHLDLLGERAAHEGALAVPVTDPLRRHHLIRVMNAAAGRVTRTRAYAVETALWSGRGSTQADGVLAVSAPPARTMHDGVPMRTFAAGVLPPSTAPLTEPDAGELIVIGTSGDDTLSRLRAGQAVSAVLLAATALGLATCPLSQPMEDPMTAGLIRDEILQGSAVPQLVVRVGWPAAARPLPRSHRRPLDEVVSYLPGARP